MNLHIFLKRLLYQIRNGCFLTLLQSNPFEKLIIQPWLEGGGKLITATPENQDSNAPYGHAGWTFDGENEAIVVVTIEN